MLRSRDEITSPFSLDTFAISGDFVPLRLLRIESPNYAQNGSGQPLCGIFRSAAKPIDEDYGHMRKVADRSQVDHLSHAHRRAQPAGV